MVPGVEAVLLGRAVGLLGSPARLAARLGVEEYVVLVWLGGQMSIPKRVLRTVMNIILEAERPQRALRRSRKKALPAH